MLLLKILYLVWNHLFFLDKAFQFLIDVILGHEIHLLKKILKKTRKIISYYLYNKFLIMLLSISNYFSFISSKFIMLKI